MKTAVIYYFSGTGNTELVANMIREGLSNLQYEVTVIKIEDILKNNLEIDVEKYDLIGIGSQVIGYGTPNIVSNFVKKLPRVNNKKVFIFRTAGGVAPINYNASNPMIRKLSRKGYKVFHQRLFSIGSNWMNKFDDEIVRQLYAATARKTAIMCKEVANGKERILKTDTKLKIRMEVIMFIISKVIFLVGRDMRVSEECVHCGRCVKNCPAGNIHEKDGKIKFGFSCNSCLRCVYSCPKGAITLKSFASFPLKGGYNVKKVISEVSANNEINGEVPPFFNDYIKNDEL